MDKTIIVFVAGGLVTDIKFSDNIPDDITVEVRDYDTDGSYPEKVDEHGDSYVESFYKKGDSDG